MHGSLEYIATAINRQTHAADSSKDGSIFAFGSNRFISLWNPQNNKGVYGTITGHVGVVTCVRFVQDDLMSGDDQGWLYLHQKRDNQWKTTVKLQGHQHGVSAIDALGDTIVTGSSDSTLKIWKHNPRDLANSSDSNSEVFLLPVQEISVGKRFPLVVSLAALPGTSGKILAVGSTDTLIRIFVSEVDQFIEAAVLSGHEDWVKALDFCPARDDLNHQPLTLASGSQDGTIRLWAITQATLTHEPQQPTNVLDDQLLDAFETALGEMNNEEYGKQVSMKQHLIKVRDETGSHQFHITFDALLVGHDAGVTSVSWKPSTPQVLLSTSTDSSAILWSPTTLRNSEQSTQLWTNHQRFGDVGGQRLGGFVSGCWLNPTQIVACAWNGGARRWGCIDGQWDELQAITGHSSAVHGIDWEPAGRYLISASLDQTVRIHGSIDQQSTRRWLELARAQVHGYDCIDARFISEFQFASIADEKVVRIFDAPGAFVNLLTALEIRPNKDDTTSRPMAANVPPLGLSNKAVDDPRSSLGITALERPPHEAELAASTLWPEIEKIFGHGYELIALAVSHSKKLIATACKSTSLEHAVVHLVDTQTWKPYGLPLKGHTLTVTRISFNHDDRLILAVGKDRTWHLFQKLTDKDGYEAISAGKGHSRVIWDCSWIDGTDVFATASRDKTVKIWDASTVQNMSQKAVTTLKFDQAATAVSFKKGGSDASALMAVGLENGAIHIFSCEDSAFSQWRLQLELPPSLAHVDQVRTLAWCPGTGRENLLASCSDDGSVRVITITG